MASSATLGPVEDQKLRPTCWRSFVRSPHVVGRCGSPLAPSWQAPRACKRRKAVRYTSRTTPHVTCVTRHAQSRRLAVAPLHHGAPRWLHLPRAGSGGGSKLRPTRWRSFVRSPHVVGRRRRPRGKRSGRASGGRPAALHVTDNTAVTCVTRHAQNAKPTSRCRTVAPWST